MMQAIDILIKEYIRHLKGLGQSRYTLKNVRSALNRFSAFLREKGIDRAESIDASLLENYQQTLFFSGRPLALRSQSQLLGVLKGFTKFLKTRHYFITDPGKNIQLPRKPKQLPRVILTHDEINRIVLSPDIRTPKGYRDRIILEILYDTAIRRSEMSAIEIEHLDLEDGYIRVRGKGNRQRVVPVCARVCELVQNYILMVRPQFIRGKDNGFLILNRFGNPMEPNGIWAVVKRCAKKAGIKKNVSTHTFRHTCARHMMKNGAPVRHIQELLGHESLESTQIYTRVTINDLKKVHKKYHPGNNIGPITTRNE
jgi:integrase/recombinase XerD